MKRTFYTFFILTAIVILGTSGVKSVENSSTPPTGNTGATGAYCNGCHSGNTFNATGGVITVNGLPGGYTLNTVYTFSITITHATANRKRWGFAIKAVNANGAVIGTFTTTNPNASASSSVIGELRHSNAPLLTTGVNTFTYNNLKWAAPLTNNLADKTVRFFLVAVAADGTGGTNADFVYSKLVTIPPATVVKSFTPVKSATGTSVTIKGTSFTGATDVNFGGTIAQSFVVNNDSTITAVVGAGASGSVSVTSPAGTASLAGFTYCAVTPTITNVNLSGCNSLVFNDSTYFTSAVVRDTIRTVNGCDSIYKKTNITIKSISPTSQSANQSVCDKFVYKNITYNSSTVIKDTLRTQEGCDSIFLTINATVNPSVNGIIYHPTKGLINGVKIVQTGTATNTLTASGNYNASCLAANSNVTLKPSKNNDVTKANGLTGIDALLIQRHILNTTKLTNAYKLIAADVDGNKTINSLDVLRVKRLVLGTDTTFTSTTKGNRLWEFVDSAYVFPDTTNPFSFKDSISFSSLSTTKNNQSFIGVKLGDVNYDWNASMARQSVNSLQLTVDRKEQVSTIRYTLSTINFKDI
ncbi:MAG: dockerin type I domain-containing protein, partial [Bacteroidetes bacterium]|nr:dockerin type I domain-containing protein [Bacteroidota bacterium]